MTSSDLLRRFGYLLILLSRCSIWLSCSAVAVVTSLISRTPHLRFELPNLVRDGRGLPVTYSICFGLLSKGLRLRQDMKTSDLCEDEIRRYCSCRDLELAGSTVMLTACPSEAPRPGPNFEESLTRKKLTDSRFPSTNE